MRKGDVDTKGDRRNVMGIKREIGRRDIGRTKREGEGERERER